MTGSGRLCAAAWLGGIVGCGFSPLPAIVESDAAVEGDAAVEDDAANPGDACDAPCLSGAFATMEPIKISANRSCTTTPANAGRKIAVDGSGTVYAVMQCEGSAQIVISSDRGTSYSDPFDLSAALPASHMPVSHVAVASGPGGVAYIGMILEDGSAYVRSTMNRGASWGDLVPIGRADTTKPAGIALQPVGDGLFCGFLGSDDVSIVRNCSAGAGTVDTTHVAMNVQFFDLLYDSGQNVLVVAGDTPSFLLSTSSDAGVSFTGNVNPPGVEHYSDWAIGNRRIFVSGTFYDASSNATALYAIRLDALSMSTRITGLPAVSTQQSRSVAADVSGDAFIASQLDVGGVQLDRLAFAATVFDPPRALHTGGASPVVAALPANQGVAVAFTVGTEVWASIQVYGDPRD